MGRPLRIYEGGMMGYCMSCGRNAKLRNGLCRQCAEDAQVSRRHRPTADLPDRITVAWIAENAKRYRTAMARAFLTAAVRHG